MAPKRPLGDVVREQEKKRPKRTVLAVKQPLGAVVPEQEAAWPPRKRLKRTVLVVMWLLEGSAAPRRERKEKVVSPTSSLFGVSSEPTFVPLDLLREITDGFSKERKIGSGSYGEVYLGVHQDGQKIAVKKIYDMPGVDDNQFQNELKNLTRLRHKNIVQLVGYCHDIQEVQVKYQGKLIIAEKINRALCLEYMPNGSLEKYISDECDKYDWHTGYGIINGICQGLKYLHTELNPPIYHLDLKPANVLLDENMVPRIADFGISRLFGDERTRATKSTLGTHGYLPPEYIRYNLISSKFDIFSLGVVIIKIMAGRSGYFNIADMSPQEFTNLVQEKWSNRLHETLNLMKAHSEQVKICIEIGLRCVDDDRQRRPSIQDIVNRLHETETECAYAARKDRSSIYQLKVNQSTMPAYKKSHKRENSGGLTHDYFMNNSRPVHEVPLNNDVGPSIQARTAWQYPTDMTAQHELGEQQAALLPYGNYELPYGEMQGRQAASIPNVINDPPRQMSEGFPETGGITRVKLRFVDVDRPENPLFTGCPVKWQNGKKPKVAIFENDTQITQGDLSKLQIEILAVNADFFTEQGQEDFTKEQFDKQIYLCQGKELVLRTVNLANGEAYLDSFFFTESSQRKRLRLTARVKKQDLAVRVQEAITDPFVVQVSRNKANKKSYPPSKEEAVHCLERIAADGKHCQYLASKSITTVKHFMRHYHIDKSGLQKLTDMKKENWSTLIKHATTSDPGVEIYSYGVAEENIELLFNDFYDLVGMMIDGVYVPVNDLDQLHQRKANNWKKSAYKKFDERESLGGLTPDYFMDKNSGRPVREVPLNNDAGPSGQARTTWQYPNDMAAQHEFGDRRPLSVFSQAAILSNNDAGPSNQETLPFSQPVYGQTLHQGLGEHGPSIPQYGTPSCLPQGNILNDQGQFSAQSTIPPHNMSPVPQDDMITGASLTAQKEGTSSLDHVFADSSSGLPSDQFEDYNWLDLDVTEYLTNYGITPANNADLPNSNTPFDGYGHDGGN